jgi:Protein of unknown function (DUF3110)
MRVYVLLFNAGTANEGIHTIREGDRNKVLMFESEDDATRFALMLEAQDFPEATVEAMESEEIKEFCKSTNFDCELVSDNGNLTLPPEINVEETDWQVDDTRESTDKLTPQKDTDEEQYSDAELESLRRRLEGLL